MRAALRGGFRLADQLALAECGISDPRALVATAATTCTLDPMHRPDFFGLEALALIVTHVRLLVRVCGIRSVEGQKRSHRPMLLRGSPKRQRLHNSLVCQWRLT